nr:iron-containing alcohol dehydrogenase [uncultured Oscillibacter sp.]
MENFVYECPAKVLFGRGAAKEHLGKALSAYGPNVMLAYGGGSIRGNGVYDEMMEILRAADKAVTEFRGITPNPTYAKVQEGAALAREKRIDFILAVGGGSVIDCCKVVAAQAVLEEDIWDMELVRHRLPSVPPIPMGAVVTASGTGAEMNGGAVITHEEKKIKTGIFAAAPRFAVLDPEYTLSVPFSQVISGAFDTLSHAMETYFGRADRDNVSDDIAEAVMRNTIRGMRALLQNPDDYTARSNLMWDSAMAENGILKCGRATDFQAHQIEHQLGAYTDCGHGQGLAVIHPPLYRRVCEKALEKFARLAVNVWGVSGEGKTERELALAGVEALADFIAKCGLPLRLRDLRMKGEPEKLLTDSVLREISDSCNLIQTGQAGVSHDEIFEILKECL